MHATRLSAASAAHASTWPYTRAAHCHGRGNKPSAASAMSYTPRDANSGSASTTCGRLRTEQSLRRRRLRAGTMVLRRRAWSYSPFIFNRGHGGETGRLFGAYRRFEGGDAGFERRARKPIGVGAAAARESLCKKRASAKRVALDTDFLHGAARRSSPCCSRAPFKGGTEGRSVSPAVRGAGAACRPSGCGPRRAVVSVRRLAPCPRRVSARSPQHGARGSDLFLVPPAHAALPWTLHTCSLPLPDPSPAAFPSVRFPVQVRMLTARCAQLAEFASEGGQAPARLRCSLAARRRTLRASASRTAPALHAVVGACVRELCLQWRSHAVCQGERRLG